MMFSIATTALIGTLGFNLRRNLKRRLVLEDWRRENGVWESLSVGVPVRNEVQNLQELLPQICDQRLQPKEWIFLDDQSEDGTRDLLNEWQKKIPNLRIVDGQPLPTGWRGKVWALHQLAREMRTEQALFLDADVRLTAPQSLSAVRSTLGGLNLPFATVFPRATVGAMAAVLVDQIYTHLYYFLPSSDSFGERAVAGCGQMMLIQLSALQSLGGFGRIRASTHDGLQLARLFRGQGHAVPFADGGSWVSCKTYENLSDAFLGFSRNAFEASGSWPVVLAISGTLFWVFVLPYVFLPFFLLHPVLLIGFLILLWSQVELARSFGLGFDHVLLTPVKASASVATHLWGAARVSLGMTQRWRGRPV